MIFAMKTAPIAYNLSDASKSSGVPESGLRHDILAGRLSAKVSGDRILIPAEALADYVSSLPNLQPARTADEEIAHKNMISEGLRSHGRAVVARVMPPLRPKGGAK